MTGLIITPEGRIRHRWAPTRKMRPVHGRVQRRSMSQYSSNNMQRTERGAFATEPFEEKMVEHITEKVHSWYFGGHDDNVAKGTNSDENTTETIHERTMRGEPHSQYINGKGALVKHKPLETRITLYKSN